jgi:hypothetical protein
MAPNPTTPLRARHPIGIRTRLILAKQSNREGCDDIPRLVCRAHVRSSGNRTPQLAALAELEVLRGDWLGGRDSNPDNMLQRHASYRWTTSQHQSCATRRETPIIAGSSRNRSSARLALGSHHCSVSLETAPGVPEPESFATSSVLVLLLSA